MPLTLTTLPTLPDALRPRQEERYAALATYLDALPERPGTHWELFTWMVYDLKALAVARDEETHR